MKAKKCYVVVNTRWGRTCAPYWCSSIRAAIRYAKELGMAYRVFDEEGNLLASGW